MIGMILDAKGWSQERLADEMGVSQATVSRWVAGSEPRGPRLLKLQEMHDEASGRRTDSPVKVDAVRVPLISWVSAGALITPDAVIDIENARMLLVADIDPAGDWVALEVDGTSMDRISPPGSHILVNMRDRRLVANACYVIMDDETGEATYKRFRPSPERFEPVSTFPEHETLFVPPTGSPRILGRVRRTILDL